MSFKDANPLMMWGIGVLCVSSDDVSGPDHAPRWPLIAQPQSLGKCNTSKGWKWTTFGDDKGHDAVLHKIHCSGGTRVEFHIRLVAPWGTFPWCVAKVGAHELRCGTVDKRMVTGSVSDVPLAEMVRKEDDACQPFELCTNALDGDVQLSASYRSVRMLDADEGMDCLTLAFDALELRVTPRAWERMPRVVHARDPGGDKMVVHLRTVGTPPPALQSVYLGRPQDIYTNSGGTDRVYLWLPMESGQEFGGAPSPRQQAEELGDLKRMHRSNEHPDHPLDFLVSPRTIAFDGTYMPDGRNVKNACRRLPLFVGPGQTIELCLANLRYEPPRSLSYCIGYKEFVDRRAGQLNPDRSARSPQHRRRGSLGDKIRNRRLSWTVGRAQMTSMEDDTFHMERYLGAGQALRLRIMFRIASASTSSGSARVEVIRIRLDAANYQTSLTLSQQPQRALTAREMVIGTDVQHSNH